MVEYLEAIKGDAVPQVSIEKLNRGLRLHCTAPDFMAIKDYLWFQKGLGDVEWAISTPHFDGMVAFEVRGIDDERVRTVQRAIQGWVNQKAKKTVEPDRAPPYTHLYWL